MSPPQAVGQLSCEQKHDCGCEVGVAQRMPARGYSGQLSFAQEGSDAVAEGVAKMARVCWRWRISIVQRSCLCG